MGYLVSYIKVESLCIEDLNIKIKDLYRSAVQFEKINHII